MVATKEFSPYTLGLGGHKKVTEQVKLIAGLDPFQLADCGAATRDLPPSEGQ